MYYLVAVFKSRMDGMEFGSNMLKYGVRVTAVSTPRGIGSSCTMSVKFPKNAISVAQRVLSSGEYFSFVGFYNI